jgi:hypothetical protein
MQSIWQAGSEGTGGVYRDAHSVLTDTCLGQDSLAELNRCMASLGDNGKDSLLLAILIALAARLHSLTPDPALANKALSFLSDARKLALKWLNSVTENEAYGATSIESQKHAGLLGAICRSTFHLDNQTASRLFEDSQNVVSFVYSAGLLTSVQGKIELFPPGVQLLFRRDQQLSYRLEEHIYTAIKTRPRILDTIATRLWSSYVPGSEWVSLPTPGQRWWKTTTLEDLNRCSRGVYVDTSNGTMLVDGKTLGYLPAPYLAHSSYKELFESLVSHLEFNKLFSNVL